MSATYKASHYSLIQRIEKNHFWFAARNRLIVSTIHRFLPYPKGKTFFEIGFGTGIVLKKLQEMGFSISGIDVNRKAIQIAPFSLRGNLYQQSIYSYRSRQHYDAVGAFDVLEHQRDDRAFLKACFRLLNSDGYLFLNVPAGSWLWSQLDQEAGHKRRYGATELAKLLNDEGFTVVFESYWNMFTLPFYILWRKQKSLNTYLRTPPKLVNIMFLWFLLIEEKLLRVIRLPIGASLFVVAQKR